MMGVPSRWSMSFGLGYILPPSLAAVHLALRGCPWPPCITGVVTFSDHFSPLTPPRTVCILNQQLPEGSDSYFIRPHHLHKQRVGNAVPQSRKKMLLCEGNGGETQQGHFVMVCGRWLMEIVPDSLVKQCAHL